MAGPVTGDAQRELESCRVAIQEIDARIVELLAERTALARRTAGLKRTLGLPILDPQREAEVIRGAAARARGAGLDAETVREIFWHVVGLGRRAQEARA